VYVCSCFGVTEAQVRQHAQAGRRTPRAIAGACGAGTDCGSCVRRIQALLGRTEPCAVHGEASAASAAAPAAAAQAPAAVPAAAVTRMAGAAEAA
jgi:bacterioferritin-associated ferredoxin